ncbi:MAG: peptidylprolyl isomerase [Eubacteriales bacterium]|nr:peptidylprolyl isomerase [Eubacteriales bacterium]
MKKTVLRVVCCLLALVTLCASLTACSSDKLMTLSRQSISLNLYELYLSRQKGTLCTTYYYGSKAKYSEFWQTTISTDGTTYNDYWTAYILQCVKTYLAALYLFEEEYKLTLPQSAIDEVDEKMEELVIGDGDGSKAALNKILSDYGVNYKMLRESYIIEAKVDYLRDYLYGADLSRVSDELKDQYYRNNYVRFKQVFFANYYYIYETDADGTVIYFDSETKNPIYDKINGQRHFDESGKALTDENGSIIYYNEDGTIAYDSENGVPAYTTDPDTGNYRTASYTDEELKKISTQANDIAEFTKPGDTATFESYITKYSDDSESQTANPDGYYFPVNAQYSYKYIVDIIEQLGKMEVGEIRVVESDYGYHVIMKYELDDGAYEDSDKSVWFENESNSFSDDVQQWLFTSRCEEYLDDIKVDEKLLGQIDISMVNPNYYY